MWSIVIAFSLTRNDHYLRKWNCCCCYYSMMQPSENLFKFSRNVFRLISHSLSLSLSICQNGSAGGSASIIPWILRKLGIGSLVHCFGEKSAWSKIMEDYFPIHRLSRRHLQNCFTHFRYNRVNISAVALLNARITSYNSIQSRILSSSVAPVFYVYICTQTNIYSIILAFCLQRQRRIKTWSN